MEGARHLPAKINSCNTMSTSESTCRTVIRGAAAGESSDCAELARRYLGVVRAFLAARWRAPAAGHQPGSPAEVEQEAAGLLKSLS